MLKYEFEDTLVSAINENLEINLNEKEHKCILSVREVDESISNEKYNVTYTGSILIERLNPTLLENKYIAIDFVITTDKNYPNEIKCKINVEYEYEN
ncbi:MAG: hypothetical protein UIM53_09030 [Acutalibacteraceae bacterium]|nr:hypothetical protein [Acutalibacteraceae bacterium]